MARITISALAQSFDKNRVLHDLSLVVVDGSFFTLLGLLCLAVLALFVVYPISVLTGNSLRGADGGFTLQGFVTVFTTGDYLLAVRNTLLLALVVTPSATAVGVPLAYMVARYEFPLKAWVSLLPIATIVIPEVIVGQSWLLMLGNNGLITNVHVMVLMVNERQLKGLPAPKTWSDLMKPEYKGKVVITDPARSGTAFIQVYGLLKQFGREGLDKIARNAVVVNSSGQVFKGVAAGEFPIGITIESSAYEYVVGGQKDIKLVYPSEGTYLGPEGMFIVKGAKNMAAAKTMYDALLSKQAQEMLLVENYRRPTRTDIAVSKLTSLPDLAGIKVFPLNLQVATDEYEQLIAMWNLSLTRAK